MISDEERIQEAEDVVPCHHIPYVDDAGAPHIARRLVWGLECLVYKRHVAELIEREAPEVCGRRRLSSDSEVLRMVWKHLWDERIRRDDGLHVVGILRR